MAINRRTKLGIVNLILLGLFLIFCVIGMNSIGGSDTKIALYLGTTMALLSVMIRFLRSGILVAFGTATFLLDSANLGISMIIIGFLLVIYEYLSMKDRIWIAYFSKYKEEPKKIQLKTRWIPFKTRKDLFGSYFVFNIYPAKIYTSSEIKNILYDQETGALIEYPKT